jgi:hypothetical protein
MLDVIMEVHQLVIHIKSSNTQTFQPFPLEGQGEETLPTENCILPNVQARYKSQTVAVIRKCLLEVSIHHHPATHLFLKIQGTCLFF